MDYSETCEVYVIKVGIYSKLNDYMERFKYQRPGSFFDLCPRSLRMKLDLRGAIQDHWSSGLKRCEIDVLLYIEILIVYIVIYHEFVFYCYCLNV